MEWLNVKIKLINNINNYITINLKIKQMKRIFILLLLAFSSFVNAQNYTPINNYGQTHQRFKVTQNLKIPYGSNFARNTNDLSVGDIYLYLKSDTSALSFFDGIRFKTFVDSLSVSNDSTFFWKWGKKQYLSKTFDPSTLSYVDTIYNNIDTVFFTKKGTLYSFVMPKTDTSGLSFRINQKLNIADTAGFATRTWSNNVHPRFDGSYNNPTWVNTLHTDKLFNASATFPQSLVADGSGGFVPYTLPAVYTSDTSTMLVPYRHWNAGYTPQTRTITTTAPLTGSGSLANDLTLAINLANTTTTGALTSTDWNTFNNKYNLPTFTNGSVIYYNGTNLAENNANFFWNNTQRRLGLNTNTPTGSLTINRVAGQRYFNTLDASGVESVSLSDANILNFQNAGVGNSITVKNPSSVFGGVDIGISGASGTGYVTVGQVGSSTTLASMNSSFGSPNVTLRRPGLTNNNTIDFRTGGTLNWAVGQNSTINNNNLYISRFNIATSPPCVEFNYTTNEVKFNSKIIQPTTPNSPKGTATLVNGVVTISNVQATTDCFITVNYRTGTALTSTSSILVVTNVTNSTGFTVTAYNAGAATTNTSDNNQIEYTISN